MYENPTRAFTFYEGILAKGGLSPAYSVRPKAFLEKKVYFFLLFLGCWLNRGVEMQVTGGFAQAGGSAAVEGDEGASSDGEESSPDSLQVKNSSHDDKEDLESRLARKRTAVSPKPVPAPCDIQLRLRSASGQKAPPATKTASELPPIGVKGSLSKHLRSSSFVRSSHAPIEIPTAPSSSCVRDKTPEVSVARVTSTFEISPHHATGTSKPSQFEGFAHRSPLAPLFADALPFLYVPKWKITQSLVVGTPETAWDFLSHTIPPFHRFMNSSLGDDLFDDQYSMSLYEGFFRGVGMLQRVDDLRKENEGLKSDLKTSQSVDAELRCQVVQAERILQEEKVGWGYAGAERASLGEGDTGVGGGEIGVRGVETSEGSRFRFSGAAEHYHWLITGLSKLDKEFGGKTPALLEKILEHLMISIDELKVLLTPAGPSSPKSLSGGDSQ
ncbi:hypothetical protein Hanom_Chr04g00352001 [Helianthus anomalus]